nr:uncharacterized protein LOC122580903 isoform X2 [Erigeron canadensis]
MINEGISQSILVSGESGVGKTENAKQLVRSLSYVGGRAATDGRSIEQKVRLGKIEFTKGKEMDSSTPKDEKSWLHLKTAAELLMEMDPKKVVVDIISDDDHKWLTTLLKDVDDDVYKDDDKVIMVVNENKKYVVKNLKVKLEVKDCLFVDDTKDIDDGECVVLGNDPNENLEVKNDGGECKKGGVDEDEDEDIVIISEKGQVACRDYPHSRHLCVNFPFSTTPNQSHCKQCYCYVCDSLAPCVYWGNGSATTDHCHATDKDSIWRLARENARNDSKGIQPVEQPLRVDPQRLAPAIVQPQKLITRPNSILGPCAPNFRDSDELPNSCRKTQVVTNNKGKWNDEVQCNTQKTRYEMKCILANRSK